jgi:hypothetical protein
LRRTCSPAAELADAAVAFDHLARDRGHPAPNGQARSESLEAASYAMARAIANAAANQFAVGRRPHLARD